MIARDEIVTLPSGTELSIEAAVGDIWRAAEYLADNKDDIYAMSLGSDLAHVAELIDHLDLPRRDSKPAFHTQTPSDPRS